MKEGSEIQESMLNMEPRKPIAKKDRVGRWSAAEINHFEILLQKFGKNWKKIYQNMKGRTLSQIRSHAQKYFDKVGPRKVDEFQRRAKLIEAYEILEKEQRLRQEAQKPKLQQEFNPDIKIEENDSPTALNIPSDSSQTEMVKQGAKLSTIIKEQSKQISDIKDQKFQKYIDPLNYYPFCQGNSSFLVYMIQQNPEAFALSGYGIEAFVDDIGFRAHTFRSL